MHVTKLALLAAAALILATMPGIRRTLDTVSTWRKDGALPATSFQPTSSARAPTRRRLPRLEIT